MNAAPWAPVPADAGLRSSATSLETALSPADEKRIAKALAPPIAWPTLILAAVLPATFWSLIALGLAHRLPLWICAPLLTVLSYAHYTLVHESVHGNLVPGLPRLRWLNTLAGWIGALGQGTSWPVQMRSHILHHAHTNTDDDPDIFVKGTLGQLVIKWLIYLPTSLIPPALARRLKLRMYKGTEGYLSGSEVFQATLVSLATLALLGLAIWTEQMPEWLCLFFIPTRCAGLILAVFFSWLPHHPFDRTERYLNTRISLWPGGTFLTLQQNLHLMHHLWPAVPFYNYARLYRRLRPILVCKGSRIEGFLIGKCARDRSVG